MLRKLLQQRSARFPIPRRRLAFESLEPRLLLSADLAPVDGVLGIVGTDGDDALLLRQLESRLLVVLNNETFEVSLDGVETIKVDLGAGADAMILEGSTALPAVQIDLGEGDNRFQAVLEDPDGMLALVSGRGNDTVGVQATWHGSQTSHPDFLWLPTFNTGDGDDLLDFSAVMGVDPEPFMPKVKIEISVDAGGGNDVANLDTLLGGESAEAVYRLDMGDGDNEARLLFGDGVNGARPPTGDTHVQAGYRSGQGADAVSVKYTMFLADGTPVRANAFDLDVLTGGGDDKVDLAAGGDADTLDIAIDTGDGNDAVMFNPTELTIRKSAQWRIDTGAGDDELAVDTTGVRLAADSQVQWLTDMGAGDDDATHIRANWEIDAGVDYRWATDLGDGTNSLTVSVDGQAIGDGASVGYQFLGGDGGDRIEVALRNLSLAGSAAFAMTTDAGDGDNLIRHEVTHVWQQAGGQPPPDDIKPAEFRIAAGAGDDIIDFSAVMGIEPQPFAPALNLDLRTGDGDDTVLVGMLLPAVQAAREAANRTNVDLGNGDDDFQLEVRGIPPPDDTRPAEFRPAEFLISAGAGDDKVAGSFFDIYFDVEVDVDAGSGDDVVDVSAVMGVEPQPFAPALDLDLRTGDGDDTVLVGMLLPAVQAAREAVHRANFDLGAGNDVAGLAIETINAGAGINPCCIVGIDAGLGGDKVKVDARGSFDVFDLRVDLGADTGADTIPTEQLSLNFEEIKFQYRTQSTHTYDYQSGDGAKAVYHAGLRSDGELVQAVTEADTVGGLVFDQVDVEIGGSQTVTVGASMTISVGGARTESVRDDLAAAYRLATTLGGSDGAAMQGDVVLKRGLGGNSLTLDLGTNDVPTRAGFANVTGLTSEVTPAEYRAGAEIGDDLTLNIDMSGVDAFSLLTGDASDEIDVDLAYPTVPVPTLMVESGGGDDTIGGTLLGVAGPLKITLDTGEGDDDIALDYTEAAAIVTGAGMGGLPEVKAFSGASSVEGNSFLPYTPSFTGGVRVAVGDVNNDGVADVITGAGPGGGSHVKVIDGRSGGDLYSFFAFGSQFAGGVFVAAGDLNGDGFDDIITGADAGGGPHVKVFDGQTGAELRSFFAYSPGFLGGVRVASGDVNGDGYDDIITGAGAGGGPHVKVFDGQTGAELRSFFAYDPAFTGGVFVAAGDVDGDGFADIVTGAGAGGGPHVKVFSGAAHAELSSFFAYTPSFTGGVRVAAGDVNGDGRADIVTGAGPGAGPHVKVFDGATTTEIRSFFAYDPGFTGGVYVAAGDIDHDTPGTFDLAVDVGDGNDTIKLGLVTGGSRSDRIDALLGDGADRFELDWDGALRDPSANVQVEVNVDPGGSGFLPEVGDEVLVNFEHGDLNRPIVIGALWNSNDQPPPDDQKPPPDDEHLRMSLSNASGVLSSSLDLVAGAGDDDVAYFVRGVLDTTATGLLSATIDLGDGTNTATITYTGLESEGPKKLAPVSVDVRGGAGYDSLVILGTEGNDFFTLTGSSATLEGVGRTGFAGFESVQVYALGGNDRVAMTGFDPRIRWLVDGGAGHDQFLVDFAFDRNPMVVNFEKVKTKKLR